MKEMMLLLLYIFLFLIAHYWKLKSDRAEKLLRYYVDGSYDCCNCQEVDGSCQLREANEVIEFYANTDHWSVNRNMSGGFSQNINVMVIDDEPTCATSETAGKRAREYKKKYKGKEQ